MLKSLSLLNLAKYINADERINVMNSIYESANNIHDNYRRFEIFYAIANSETSLQKADDVHKALEIALNLDDEYWKVKGNRHPANRSAKECFQLNREIKYHFVHKFTHYVH